MEAIFAVTNTSEVVVKIRPEKDLGSYGIWAHDLCGETGIPMQERMKEHERVYVQLVPMPRSLWNEVKFFDRDSHWYTRRIKEAIHIRLPEQKELKSTNHIRSP